MPLPLKSLNKRLIATFILILLKKKVHKIARKLSTKSTFKLAKGLYISSLKNYSTIQELPNHLAMKEKPPLYLQK